jgi:predicted ATPase
LLDDGAGAGRIAPRLIQELHRAAPAVIVLEDLHWADEATLDIVKYLARRLGEVELFFILTFRDDELSSQHPLRSLLAVLATCRMVRRVPLWPLSLEAVRELIGASQFDAGAVHRQTGGNPFLVTELLASREPDRVPEAVRDIVLQRAGGLPAAARRVLETAAVIGPRANASLLWKIVGDDAAQTDTCIDAGLLRVEGNSLITRHELTRQAILDSIAPPRRAMLHAHVLKVLEEEVDTDASLLAHHAEEAGNAEAVRRHAPVAAQRARALGSHREAAQQFARALRHMKPQATEERALLLEAIAEEWALLDQQGKPPRRAAKQRTSGVSSVMRARRARASLCWHGRWCDLARTFRPMRAAHKQSGSWKASARAANSPPHCACKRTCECSTETKMRRLHWAVERSPWQKLWAIQRH